MPIELKEAEIKRIRFKTKTSQGVVIFMDVTDDGLEFFVNENSAGNIYDKPVCRTPDQIWDWIKGDGAPPLEKRAVVQRTLNKKLS